jgi:putative tryptophan/tyrosine transport system substrate-binding protein
MKSDTARNIALAVLALLCLTACTTSKPEHYVIGIVNLSPSLDAVVEGFQAGMDELGYTVGENVSYIYDGAVLDIDALDPAVQRLMEADVDLMLALTTPAALSAKKAVEGTDVPVIFVPVTDPVGSGLVESLAHPGGSVTGIRTGGSIGKGLDWLLAAAPGISRLFVLHNPADDSSTLGLEELSGHAAALGLDLVVAPVRTADAFDAALASVPEEVDAIFVLPSGFFSARGARFAEAALAHLLPTVSVSPLHRAGLLMSYGLDYYEAGKQASRLTALVLRGAVPADLPVETAESYLGINLQTARAINLDIPDDIVGQADHIIR